MVLLVDMDGVLNDHWVCMPRFGCPILEEIVNYLELFRNCFELKLTGLQAWFRVQKASNHAISQDKTHVIKFQFYFLTTTDTQLDDSMIPCLPYGCSCSWRSFQLKKYDNKCKQETHDPKIVNCEENRQTFQTGRKTKSMICHTCRKCRSSDSYLSVLTTIRSTKPQLQSPKCGASAW